MSEWQLFEPGTVPEYATPDWYANREVAPHLEQDGHRDRLLLTAQLIGHALSDAARHGNADPTVADLGAGDGGLLSLVPSRIRRWGYDLQQSNVDAAAVRTEHVKLLDVVASWPDVESDIVIATEFLEHLLDPHEMVRRIASTKARYLIASSPYTETDAHHYEFHLWAWDEPGYRALLEDNGWKVLRQQRSWICQVLLAVKS